MYPILQIHALEKQTGQIFGGRPLERAQPHTVGHSKPHVADSFSRPALPLLVSVRTGASGRGHGTGDSMLNVGMTDATVAALMEVNLGELILYLVSYLWQPCVSCV